MAWMQIDVDVDQEALNPKVSVVWSSWKRDGDSIFYVCRAGVYLSLKGNDCVTRSVYCVYVSSGFSLARRRQGYSEVTCRSS